MKQSLDAMKTAVRILSAITEHREPDPADVLALEQYGQRSEDMGLDEFACDVIQCALQHRAQVRGQRGRRAAG